MKKNRLHYRPFIILLAIIIAVFAFVKYEGQQQTITKEVGEYDFIKLSGSYNVDLVSGKEGTISITANEKVINNLEVKNNDGILSIRMKKKGFSQFYGNDKTKIEIPIKSINGLKTSGSNEINGMTKIITDEFDLELSGSSKSKLNIQTKKSAFSISGSGSLTLQGYSDQSEIHISGSGKIESYDFKISDLEVSISGSGNIKTTCTNKLDARVSGSGNIYYRGNPETSLKVSGSGSIKKED